MSYNYLQLALKQLNYGIANKSKTFIELAIDVVNKYNRFIVLK